ncbi:DHA2 family efflux MFS transporter permease subunit [Cytophagaceae bacterium YF14B1]|uniref:DHA2 family efflux MFS transporter permease subunit n=1 Tax=Xanthocytophaga flava TaxID=3048013 RepID=A0AAE3QJJ1_9BACT|nr:DHA2 family efflux MFS transporter permease subunit [Xanthocytophaga flavus]MDJ1480532.1 DHA2 family efflux MFS transporter permease subunit [Xanthocytophaga flavus]
MAAKGFNRIIIIITTISAAIMELLDTTIVNVALNQMAGSLGATIEDVAWVVTSYAIANVIIIPMTGFLAEYFGRKTYYLASMIIFTVASYFCGASEGLWELVFWRFIQGVGGGALLSTSQSILFDAFEPKDRPIASGLFGMGIVLGPTLGPTLGGLIVDNLTWSDIFYVNLPIGVLASILTILFIEKKEGEGTRKKQIQIDYLGIFLLTAGIGSLQFILEKGESEDWFDSHLIILFTAVAVVGLVSFVVWELYTKHPVVNLKVLKHRTLALTLIFTFVSGIGLFTSVFVYPVLVQRINGFTSTMTGLSLMFPTLIAIPMFPIIGKQMAKGARPVPFIVVGFLLFIAFGIWAGTLSGDANMWDFFPAHLLRVLGISMLQLPLINQAVAGLQPQEYPTGISLNNMVRQLGGATGIAIANNYVTNRVAQHRSDLMSNMTSENPLFMERLNGITNTMASRTGEFFSATQMAYRQMEGMVMKQAYLLAYLDTFRIVSLFFIVIFPLIFLLRTPKKSQEEAQKAALAAADSH